MHKVQSILLALETANHYIKNKQKNKQIKKHVSIIVKDHVSSSKVSWLPGTIRLLLHAQTAKHIVGLCPCLPVINLCALLQKNG